MVGRVRSGARAVAEKVRRLTAAERGQSMVEYAIVTALIAIVALGAVQALGGGVTTVFNNIVDAITGI
jgi:pilus assembly protein Flp/PilA